MISHLPEGFTDAINATSRKPVQLAHMTINGVKLYLSDTPLGIADGLMHEYTPIVESWGVIKDTSDLDVTFTGSSLEVKSIQLSLIVVGATRDLFLDALQVGIDNSQIEIYQWFAEYPWEPPQLIDIFLAQDPISFTEASSLFKIDGVSVLMRNNPYLHNRQEGAETRDIVIGKVDNMPLYDLQTSRWSKISEDMTFDYVGPVYVDNGVGFPLGPYNVMIDSEIVTYDWITASTMNVIARGVNGTLARPHIAGARFFSPTAVFDYAVSAGPVESMSDLIADGNPYPNDVLYIAGQDPTIVRFTGRPPWLKVTPGYAGVPIQPDDVSESVYGTSATSDYGNDASPPSSIDAINSPSGSATLNISSIVGSPDTSVIFPNNIATTVPVTSTDWYDVLCAPYTDECDFDMRSGLLGQCELNAYTTATYPINTSDSLTFGKGEIEDIHVNFTIGQQDDFCIEANVQLVIGIHDKNGGGYFSYTKGFGTVGDGDYVGQPAPVAPWMTEAPISAFVNIKQWADLEGAYCIISVANKWYMDPITLREHRVHLTVSAPEWVVTLKEDDSFTQPWQQVASIYGNDLSNLGTLSSVSLLAEFTTSGSNAVVDQDISIKSAGGSESVLWSRSSYNLTDTETYTLELPLPYNTWEALTNASAVFYQQIVNAGTTTLHRVVNTSISRFMWIITYTPDELPTPDEERVIYAEEMHLTVTSNWGADPTPAQVIEGLIDQTTVNGPYIYRELFETRHQEYLADSYFFNGLFPGDIRLHEALRQCLLEGMARFLFAEGSIGLLNYKSYENTVIDYTVDDDIVAMRSKQHNNQSTDSIVNDYKVVYDYNAYKGEFEQSEHETDVDSINRFTSHDLVQEHSFITSQAIAHRILAYTLARRAYPISVLSFDTFMATYPVQKGDQIAFTSIHGGRRYTGHVTAKDRIVGKGKSGQINKFTLYIADGVSTSKLKALYDGIKIDDSNFIYPTTNIWLRITDSVGMRDPIFKTHKVLGLVDSITVDDSSFDGAAFVGIFLSDEIEVYDGSTENTISVGLSDVVDISDTATSFSSTLRLTDAVDVSDTGLIVTTDKKISLVDQVVVDDSVISNDGEKRLYLTDTVTIGDTFGEKSGYIPPEYNQIHFNTTTGYIPPDHDAVNFNYGD